MCIYFNKTSLFLITVIFQCGVTNVWGKKPIKKTGNDIDWTFKKGDKIKVEVYNDPNSMHSMQHPIHFHGQRFLVLSRNGAKNNSLVWKDTELVRVGEKMEILIDMSNPGNWMAHCHISEHLESGMMLNFKVID